MIALLVVFSVYSCTFVGCNGKLDSGFKAGFFVTYALVAALILFLSLLLS